MPMMHTAVSYGQTGFTGLQQDMVHDFIQLGLSDFSEIQNHRSIFPFNWRCFSKHLNPLMVGESLSCSEARTESII